MYSRYLFCCLNFRKKPIDNKEKEKEKNPPSIKNILKNTSFDSVSSSASTIDLQVRTPPKKL
tara:strand:+ start:180 stop:365 length:186 start_codon:yes stop_codon:yes gene_type:complete